MKRIFLICSLFLFCGLLPAAEREILCTTLPIQSLTNAVIRGVPGYRTALLLSSVVGCPHDYALTPRDMKALSQADIIVLNGLGMEDFLGSAIERTNKKAQIIDSSKGVPGVLPDRTAHRHSAACKHDHDHDHDSHKQNGDQAMNEHLFASPSTAANVVLSIAAQLAKNNPADAVRFRTNAEAYAKQLRDIAEEYRKFGRTIPADRKNIVLQHGIFDYMARDLGLNVTAYLQPHPSQEPSAAELIGLIRGIRKEKVRLLIGEHGYPAKVSGLVAREAKIPVVTLTLYAPKNNADPDWYLKQFRTNLDLLKKTQALQ